MTYQNYIPTSNLVLLQFNKHTGMYSLQLIHFQVWKAVYKEELACIKVEDNLSLFFLISNRKHFLLPILVKSKCANISFAYSSESLSVQMMQWLVVWGPSLLLSVLWKHGWLVCNRTPKIQQFSHLPVPLIVKILRDHISSSLSPQTLLGGFQHQNTTSWSLHSLCAMGKGTVPYEMF